ncbi:zinc ribbon domain-containing protein [candidate division KSB1 bacterium]
MHCPHCLEPIEEDTTKCPDCGKDITPSEKVKKEGKKEFTHYRLILLNPGRTEETIETLAEITQLKPKKIKKILDDLPWTVKSRIPFSEAQELKILLNRTKAEVRIEGMDIWAESDEEDQDDAKKDKRHKRNIRLFLASMGFVAAVLIYILLNLDKMGGQGLLQLEETQVEQPEMRTGLRQRSGGETSSGSERGQSGQMAVPKDDINLHDEGSSPFICEISIRFDLKEQQQIFMATYDTDLNPVAVLLDQSMVPESYRVKWNGMSDNNTLTAPGIYYVMVVTSSGIFSHKFVWLGR